MTTIAGIIDSVQAARIAGCHPNTVNRWCQSGDLRSVKVGKKYAIREDDLTAYLQAHPEYRPSLPGGEQPAQSPLIDRAKARVIEHYGQAGIPAEKAAAYLQEFLEL